MATEATLGASLEYRHEGYNLTWHFLSQKIFVPVKDQRAKDLGDTLQLNDGIFLHFHRHPTLNALRTRFNMRLPNDSTIQGRRAQHPTPDAQRPAG